MSRRAATSSAATATTTPSATLPTTSTPTTRHRRAARPSPSAGASHAELPATFTVTPGGSLSPPAVSSPGGLTIALAVVSGDGRAHRVVLESPVAHALAVPAGGRASALISGLRDGSYTIEVDGVARGTLVVGVQPGP